ncbi:MAG: hypothetical protein IKN17_05650 [Ruminococcus sp.]|nr:hypothetical protein [Ruminococcus sp.]
MRKALAGICYLIMLGCDGAAAYFTYRAYAMKISYDFGLLVFVPLFIGSYWFSTFFSMLIHPRNGKLLMNRTAFNLLYWLSTLLSLALLGAWAYLFIDRSLYVNFGTESSGKI